MPCRNSWLRLHRDLAVMRRGRSSDRRNSRPNHLDALPSASLLVNALLLFPCSFPLYHDKLITFHSLSTPGRERFPPALPYGQLDGRSDHSAGVSLNFGAQQCILRTIHVRYIAQASRGRTHQSGLAGTTSRTYATSGLT